MNFLRVIEQDMGLMSDDELAVEEMKIVTQLKKMAEVPNEEAEVCRHALCRKKKSPTTGPAGSLQLVVRSNRC